MVAPQTSWASGSPLRQPLALASALRSLRSTKPARRGVVPLVMWCGLVWCGVVWCAAIVLLRRIGPGPDRVHEPCAGGHDALAALLRVSCCVCMSLTRPHPFVCSYPDGRWSIASRKSKSFELVRSLVGCMG